MCVCVCVLLSVCGAMLKEARPRRRMEREVIARVFLGVEESGASNEQSTNRTQSALAGSHTHNGRSAKQGLVQGREEKKKKGYGSPAAMGERKLRV